MGKKDSAEKAVRDIRRKTRRRFSAEGILPCSMADTAAIMASIRIGASPSCLRENKNVGETPL